MSTHMIIPSRRPKKYHRHSPLMSKLIRAKEYSIVDVRQCLYDHSYDITDKECRNVFRHARLRNLSRNRMRNLRGYKYEMEFCLKYGNREAHYIEGIKQYFSLHDRPRGMKHLKIAATRNYKKGSYFYALLKLHAGDHDEGMKLLDRHKWRNNTFAVDNQWKQVKRSLHEVPIIARRSYGVNMMLIIPPRARMKTPRR
ncbi:hypothetical protein Bca4012_065580 [Brassica carinata]|uniref:At2g35280-like TPR domain-containing protein n=1 Tax=Brassica carinata TaxID=52824 RepID=A0A8X7VPG9_BRACI|nr:hypothetical protein Bca52824_017895 [Brassica carinata]